MLDTTHVLDRLQIRRTSSVQGCQDVGNLIRDAVDPLYASHKLFNDVLSVDLRFSESVYARIMCKAMIQEVINKKCIVDDPNQIVQTAEEYTKAFCANPDNSHLWATLDESEVRDVVVRVVESVDMKVAVNTNGKIKKGGKEPLARELYRINVIESTTPLTNQEFISLLMKELDMSKPGATTYRYNCMKYFEGLKK